MLANKCDLASEEQIANFRSYIEKKGLPFFQVSAATTKGTKEVIQFVAQKLQELPPLKRYEAEFIPPDPDAARNDRSFTVEMQDGVYYVDAPWLEGILSMVNMDDYSSLQYFQRVLRESGIIDKLDKMGVQEGDTVDILGFRFEYVH